MPRANFTHADKFHNCIHSQTRCSAMVLWILAPYMLPIKYTTPPTTVCQYNISLKPHTIYKHNFALYVSQNVTAGYIPPPIFVSIEYVLLPTTLCQYNISPKIPRANSTHINKFSNYIHSQTRCSATVLWILAPIFVYMEYILPATTLCQ